MNAHNLRALDRQFGLFVAMWAIMIRIRDRNVYQSSSIVPKVCQTHTIFDVSSRGGAYYRGGGMGPGVISKRWDV